MQNDKTFNVGSNNTCTINCNYRIAATLRVYTLEKWFVSGIQLYVPSIKVVMMMIMTTTMIMMIIIIITAHENDLCSYLFVLYEAQVTRTQ